MKNQKPKQVASRMSRRSGQTPLLGIDIGSRNTKLVVAKLRKDIVDIENLWIVSNDADEFFDGKIMNPNFAERRIRESISRGAGTKLAAISIDSTDVIKRELLLPMVPDNDILDMVTYEMAQYLPIDLAAYVVQYRKLNVVDDGGVQKQRVIVGAIAKSLVESYVDLNNNVGLESYAMDLHFNSLSAQVDLEIKHPNSQFKGRNVLFIDMGHSFFNMTIFRDGVFDFNRILEIGGSGIDRMIAQVMHTDARETEKVKLGLFSHNSMLDLIRKKIELQNGAPQMAEDQVLSNIFTIISNWMSEVSSVVRFYTSRGPAYGIDAVFLYGGCSHIREIEVFVEKHLGIKTQILRSLPGVTSKNKNLISDISDFINAIGVVTRN